MRISDWSSDVCSSDLSFLRGYPGQLIVISHGRDLLNNVVDHILHLEGGKGTLYPGVYDAFERQRAERAAQLAAAKAAQDAQRAKLQDYIARNSARASTAKQAQSRAKQLARMQPVAALTEDPSLVFDFPSPGDELKPPLITLDLASVGYAPGAPRSEEHTSELQSLMRISYAVLCLNTKKNLRRTLQLDKK